jgi:hypothetical protein
MRKTEENEKKKREGATTTDGGDGNHLYGGVTIVPGGYLVQIGVPTRYKCLFFKQWCGAATHASLPDSSGVFEGLARGLGCAPGSPFLCLASSPPPSARPARAKSPLSAWLPWYAIFHRSARA